MTGSRKKRKAAGDGEIFKKREVKTEKGSVRSKYMALVRTRIVFKDRNMVIERYSESCWDKLDLSIFPFFMFCL